MKQQSEESDVLDFMDYDLDMANVLEKRKEEWTEENKTDGGDKEHGIRNEKNHEKEEKCRNWEK